MSPQAIIPIQPAVAVPLPAVVKGEAADEGEPLWFLIGDRCQFRAAF